MPSLGSLGQRGSGPHWSRRGGASLDQETSTARLTRACKLNNNSGQRKSMLLLVTLPEDNEFSCYIPGRKKEKFLLCLLTGFTVVLYLLFPVKKRGGRNVDIFS